MSGRAIPVDGLGIGLRTAFYAALAARDGAGVDLFEVVAENFLGDAALPWHHLDRAASMAPVVVHGTGLDLLGADPLDAAHLGALKRLADRLDSPFVTEHLCWSRRGAWRAHELLPTPLTPGVARWAVDRVRRVQDALGRPFGVEPLAATLRRRDDTLREADLLHEVVSATGCGVLLDVNNAVVAARNGGDAATALLDAVPAGSVLYAHVAGQRAPAWGPVVDTHDAPVSGEVWAVYQRAWTRLGPFPTVLEWDADIPDYERCLAELRRAVEARVPTSDAGRAAGGLPASRRAARAGSTARSPAPPVELVRWQDDLCRALRVPLVVGEAGGGAPAAPLPDALVAQVRGSPDVPARVRLAALHGGVWTRWIEALAHDHPALRATLGERDFRALATAHLASGPPADADVGSVGRGLDHTLARSRWARGADALAVDLAHQQVLRAPPVAPWCPPPLPAALARERLRWSRAAVRVRLTAAVAGPWPLGPGAWLVVRAPSLALLHVPLDDVADDLVVRLVDQPVGEALAAWEARWPGVDLRDRARDLLGAAVRQGWFEASTTGA